MADDGVTEFCGTIKFETKGKDGKSGAYLITDGTDEFWIPKSQIISMRQIRDSDYEFLIPYWLAKDKGVI